MSDSSFIHNYLAPGRDVCRWGLGLGLGLGLGGGGGARTGALTTLGTRSTTELPQYSSEKMKIPSENLF